MNSHILLYLNHSFLLLITFVLLFNLNLAKLFLRKLEITILELPDYRMAGLKELKGTKKGIGVC